MQKNYDIQKQPGSQDFVHPFNPGKDQLGVREVERAVHQEDLATVLGGFSLVASNLPVNINDIFPPDVGSSEAVVRPVDPSDSGDGTLSPEDIFPADFLAEMTGIEKAVVAEHTTDRALIPA